MINLNDITGASDHIQDYASRMLCRRVGLNEWRVVPKVRGKSFRLVRFVKRGVWIVQCSDYRTGEPCPANRHHRLCAHVWRVVKQLTTNETRRRNKEMHERPLAA